MAAGGRAGKVDKGGWEGEEGGHLFMPHHVNTGNYRFEEATGDYFGQDDGWYVPTYAGSC